MAAASARGDKAPKLVAFGKIAIDQALAKEPKRFSRNLSRGEPLPKAREEQAKFPLDHLTKIRAEVENLLDLDTKPVQLAARLVSAQALVGLERAEWREMRLDVIAAAAIQGWGDRAS